MRMTFILLRLAGYLLVWIGAFLQAKQWSWVEWISSAIILLWCIGDQWKRPDSAASTLRLGILIETALIWAWAFILQDGVVLFVLISPLVRSCIHLKWQDYVWMALLDIASIVGIHYLYQSSPYLQLSLLIIVGLYALVLGALLREREQAKRLIAIASLERELRAKDEERMRIARQLHDRTGQYWTAIARALDVALRMDGDQRIAFITKAREASLEGLQEMRNAVTQWSSGRQMPADWIRFMEQSIYRFSAVMNKPILFSMSPALNWERLDNPATTAETIARTVIESITNAIRHGEAEEIHVAVESGEEEIRLTIADNGKGFDSLSASQSAYGIGIETMKELVHANGGLLELSSAGGRGTTISVTLPYSREIGGLAE
ncbi:signal transduction histidine kinase [Paenibacillus castaneae]|nr:signal transduction histidine kinase [Paenibacillus castaneae]